MCWWSFSLNVIYYSASLRYNFMIKRWKIFKEVISYNCREASCIKAWIVDRHWFSDSFTLPVNYQCTQTLISVLLSKNRKRESAHIWETHNRIDVKLALVISQSPQQPSLCLSITDKREQKTEQRVTRLRGGHEGVSQSRKVDAGEQH